MLGPLKEECEPNPKYVLEKGTNSHKIEYKTEGDVVHERTIEDIIRIFENVTPERRQINWTG